MQQWDRIGLEEFLGSHPRIRIAEINDDSVVLEGHYQLRAQLAGSRLVNQTYQLRFVCPRDYPKTLPKVFEEGKYFPRDQEFHTYSDGSFCLASEIKIKSLIRDDHSLTAFFEKIIDPFLYAVTHRIEFGNFPYGELAHGEQGLIDDYGEMFGLSGKLSVLRALQALGKRKRDANKLPCPCGCGLRLGRCHYRFMFNQFRSIERRSWFRLHLTESIRPFEKLQKTNKKSRTSRVLMNDPGAAT